jgi:hypothetical protein
VRERHNVRIHPGKTGISPVALPDHEVEVDQQGTIRPLLHEGRRCTFHHSERLPTAKAGEDVEWLVFVAEGRDLGRHG